MTQLDPSIVERYADHLQRKASARIMAYTIVFALLGAILGLAPLVAPNRVLVPHYLGVALLLVGAAAGGYLGYTIGVRRAEGFRLQALMTLHQLQFAHVLAQPVAAAAAAGLLPTVVAPVAAAPSPAVAPPAPAPVAPAPTLAPAPIVSAPAPLAPAPAPLAPAPLPVAAPVVAATPTAAEPVQPPASPALSPAMPPLSAPPAASEPPAPAPFPEHTGAAQPVAVPPVAAVPPLPSVPRLVEAPYAGPPTMVPPLSAER